ncbi:MAG TPA: glycosyltransferase [Melioribacteraceae bacterium]|nr:glycosyltransferase [Melioribacteraceae bacterium]
MIKDRIIIVFGDDWGRYPSTLQHLMKELIKYNKLIWIGSLGLRKPKFSFADIKRIYEKIKNVFAKKEVAKNDENITILHPLIIPLHNLSFVRLINNRNLINKINTAINNYGNKKALLISSQPIIGDIVKGLNLTSSHYFCLDDYMQFEGAFAIINKLEKELLEVVNTSFSVSDTLVKTRVPKNGESYFLPQGVNINHFVYNERAINNPPVIGFFGLLSEWVDLELIVKCAKAYPNYKFLIIGKYSVDISILNGIPNLDFIGEIPYVKLPIIASQFDIGIIPFIVNELTLACNPLKLLEYFSMGIPVVSTNLPEVAKFGDTVYIANNHEEFIESLKKAVDNYSIEKNRIRREVAERYSWTAIAENISNIILKVENK